MNLPRETAEFHGTRYARDKATVATKGKVNDHDHSNGRVTSRHGAEYFDWLYRIEDEAQRNKR